MQFQKQASEQRIVLSKAELEAKLKVLAQGESSRFDISFFSDLAIGVGVFAVAVICFVYGVPVFGNPLALLAGPVIGLILTLKHRPPR